MEPFFFSLLVKKYDNKKYLLLFCVVFRSPPLPDLDFGLCARVYPAILPQPAPAILFSNYSAVSHLKPRDFRFHEPTIPFFHLVRGFPSHFRSCDSLDQSEASISVHLGPIYYLLAFMKGCSLFDLEPNTRRLLRGFHSAFLSHLLSSFGSRQLD